MLHLLREIVQEVNEARDLQEMLYIMVNRVAESIQTEASGVYLVDKQNEQYVLAASRGFKPNIEGKISLKFSQGLVGLIAEREEPLNIEDAPNHPKYHFFPEMGEDVYHSFLGVPIIYQRQLVGIIFVQQREKRKFQEEEVAFLVTIAAQLGADIANAPLGSLRRDFFCDNVKEPSKWEGKSASPGLAIGRVVVTYNPQDLESVPYSLIQEEDKEKEWKKFKRALEKTKQDIRDIRQRWTKKLPEAEMILFDAYLQILDSDHISQSVYDLIQERLWAPWALKKTIKLLTRQFQSIEDAYLRERAHDFIDLGSRILGHLQNQEGQITLYPDETILVGEEVTASCLADVPYHKLKGVVSIKGSTNSHVAILAKAMGIPAVIGVTGLPLFKLEHEIIAIDGFQGEVYIYPTHRLIQHFHQQAIEEKALSAELEKLALLPTVTLDNRKINLMVNVGLSSDINMALTCHSDGVGLYRTEVPFMVKDRFPGEEEQRVIYAQLLNAFSDKPVVIRTLDIGGDKFLPYFPIEEKNSFLGWRGIRVMLDHPEIFLQQLRALLKSSVGLNNLNILLPMITQLSEIDEALICIQQAYQEVQEEGFNVVYPKVGAMIETPSAVYCAQKIAKRVDFLSVGTNDLTQYILAADRNNDKVANLYDPFHPAVLWALEQVTQAAKLENKPITICGEMASDPLALIILLALEFDGISVHTSMLPKLKWLIRNLSIHQVKAWYKTIRSLDQGTAIKAYIQQALEQTRLGWVLKSSLAS
jgi:phosphotransferase system enzyme I (PtsP)